MQTKEVIDSFLQSAFFVFTTLTWTTSPETQTPQKLGDRQRETDEKIQRKSPDPYRWSGHNWIFDKWTF